MPQVQIPDVGLVNFPDSMSHDDIVSAIKGNIIPQYQKTFLKPEAEARAIPQRPSTTAGGPPQAGGNWEATSEELNISPLGIDPNKVPSGKGLMAPVRAAERGAAGLGQFLTSPMGIAQSAAAITPGVGLVQRAKFLYDMVGGATDSAKNLFSLAKKIADDPAHATDEDVQAVNDNIVGLATSAFMAGKLGEHEFTQLTGKPVPTTAKPPIPPVQGPLATGRVMATPQGAKPPVMPAVDAGTDPDDLAPSKEQVTGPVVAKSATPATPPLSEKVPSISDESSIGLGGGVFAELQHSGPDRIIYEVKGGRNEVRARFDYSKDGNGIWRPTPGAGIEILDPKLRGKGIGEQFTRAFVEKHGPVGSTGLTEDEGTSADAQKMWKRIGAPIEDLPNTHEDLGAKKAWVLRPKTHSPEPVAEETKPAPAEIQPLPPATAPAGEVASNPVELPPPAPETVKAKAPKRAEMIAELESYGVKKNKLTGKLTKNMDAGTLQSMLEAERAKQASSAHKAAAKEFDDLVKQHGHERGWITEAPDMTMGSGQQGTASIRAKIEYGKKNSLARIRRRAASELTDDLNERGAIDTPEGRAKLLPKLKEHLAQKTDEGFQADIGKPRSGSEVQHPDSFPIGTKFEYKGEKFTVASHDIRNGTVKVEDGRVFGTKDIQAYKPIEVDKGTVKLPGEEKPSMSISSTSNEAGKMDMGEPSYNLAILSGDGKYAYVSENGKPETTKQVSAKTPAELIRVLREKYNLTTTPKHDVLKDAASAKRDYEAKYPKTQKPSLALDQPETIEQQKAREASELAAKQKSDQAEALKAKAAKPLVGSVGDIGQGDLLGGGDLFSAGPLGASLGAVTPSDPNEPVGKGAGGSTGHGEDVYGVAQRVREARAKAGVGPVYTPGQGWSVQQAIDWGRTLKANGADPEAAMKKFEQTGDINEDTAALFRAHGEDLAQLARKVENKFGTDSKEWRTAIKSSMDWEKRTDKQGTTWHKIGQAMQGETDIDTGELTVSRMIEKYVKDTGNQPPAGFIEGAKRYVKAVKDAVMGTEPDKARLQTTLDNLDEKGRPRFSEHVVRLAEKIVAIADKRAEASREALKKMLGQLGSGPDPTLIGHLANVAASHIAHWGLDFAKFTDAVVKEYGPKVKPYLKEAFQKGQDLLDADSKRLGGVNAEDVKQAVKKTSARIPVPEDLPGQQAVFKDFKTGERLNPQQVKTLWQRAKTVYIDTGENTQSQIVYKLSEDLKIPVQDVLKGMNQNKGIKAVADDVWRKQREVNRLKKNAKRWLEDQGKNWLQKLIPLPFKAMFRITTFGHGTVAIGTHAALNTAVHPVITADNFGKMYKLVLSPEYYELQAQALKNRPNFRAMTQTGLQVDPDKFEEYVDPRGSLQFPRIQQMIDRISKIPGAKIASIIPNMGTRGYFVLKMLRADLFDYHWNKLAVSDQTPEMGRAISDSINHMTGVVKANIHPLAAAGFFAPRLELSRIAVVVADPGKALISLASGRNMTPAQRWFLANQAREKATIFGVWMGLMYANQQINDFFKTGQKLNMPHPITGTGFREKFMGDPMKSDWMKFKGAGMDFAWGGPFLNMMRLNVRLMDIHMGDGGKMKHLIYPDESADTVIGQYFRTQLSPGAQKIADVYTKADFMKRPLPPLPWGAPQPPVPKRLEAQGVKPYTWPEYLSTSFLPIPFEEPARTVWRVGFGVSPEQEKGYAMAFTMALLQGATGGRLSEDRPDIKPMSPEVQREIDKLFGKK